MDAAVSPVGECGEVARFEGAVAYGVAEDGVLIKDVECFAAFGDDDEVLVRVVIAEFVDEFLVLVGVFGVVGVAEDCY